MTGYTRPPGKTTISPEVLTTIARMAALSVPDVQDLAPVAGSVNRLFQHGVEQGVQVSIHENIVNVDVFLSVKEAVNLRDVGRNVQQQITRAIQEMTGMDVGHVDIHIEDIHYEGSEEA